MPPRHHRRGRHHRRTPILTHIGLENFKGFKNTGFIPLKKLTFLVGKNSSGKSSLLKALAAFSQTSSSRFARTGFSSRTLNTDGKFVDIGVYDEIVNNSKKYFELSFVLKNNGPRAREVDDMWVSYSFGRGKSKIDTILKSIKVGNLLDHMKNFKIMKEDTTVQLQRNKNWSNWKFTRVETPKTEEISDIDSFYLNIGAEENHASRRSTLEALEKELSIGEIAVDVINCTSPHPRFWVSRIVTNSLKKFRNSKRYQKIKDPVKKRKALSKKQQEIRQAMRRKYQKLIAPHTRICQDFSRALDNISYIGPLREEPTRQLKISSSHTAQDVGKWGENTAQLLHDADRETKALLERAVVKMGLGLNVGTETYDSKLGPSGFIQTYLKESDGSQRVLADVGFGVSQVLPIVMECCISQDSTILLEQPELHLHPGLQTELGDLFIDSIERGNQIIVETHSVNMLERIRRRIKEGELDHNDVNIIYFTKDSKGSSSISIGLDADGDFTRPWPDDDGFFGEREKELFSDFF